MSDERKLTEADRAALEILDLRRGNIALTKQLLQQQANELARAEAELAQKQQLVKLHLAAAYGYDEQYDGIRLADGVIVSNGVPRPEPEPVAEPAPAALPS